MRIGVHGRALSFSLLKSTSKLELQVTPWPNVGTPKLLHQMMDRNVSEMCDRNFWQPMSDVVRRVGRRIRRTCWATDSVSNSVPLLTPSRARVWGLCPARRAELRSGGSIPTRGAGSVSGSCAPRRWLRAVRSRLPREGRSMSVGPFVWRGKSCIRVVGVNVQPL